MEEVSPASHRHPHGDPAIAPHATHAVTDATSDPGTALLSPGTSSCCPPPKLPQADPAGHTASAAGAGLPGAPRQVQGRQEDDAAGDSPPQATLGAARGLGTTLVPKPPVAAGPPRSRSWAEAGRESPLPTPLPLPLPAHRGGHEDRDRVPGRATPSSTSLGQAGCRFGVSGVSAACWRRQRGRGAGAAAAAGTAGHVRLQRQPQPRSRREGERAPPRGCAAPPPPSPLLALLVPGCWAPLDLSERLQGHNSPVLAGPCEETLVPRSLGDRRG